MSMEQGPVSSWEQQLRDTAQGLPYPATPDIAQRITARLRAERSAQPTSGRRSSQRLRVAFVVLVLFAASLLAVPDVRATIGNWFRLGAVEIVFPTATPQSLPTDPPPVVPTALPAEQTPISASPTAASVPRPSPTPLASVLDLTGEVTLEQARGQVPFPIMLPTYPEDLGAPDRVFVQDYDGPVAVLVWVEPGTRDQVRMSLHILGSDILAKKFVNQFTQLSETTVHGERALWVIGPHMLNFYQREPGTPRSREVDGHVLIWQEGDVTYRLETESSIEEAVRIAETIQ